MVLTKVDTRFLRPAPRHVRRAWYQDPAADIILEHDRRSGDLVTFEIDWDGEGRRAYVRWDRSVGIRTGSVDTGEGTNGLHHKQSPMIYIDPRTRRRTVDSARRLVWDSGIDEGHRDSILKHLRLE